VPDSRFLLAATLLATALAAQATSVGGVDFNRDVRPILSDRCFKCHGFDARARQADLRLDTAEGIARVVSAGDPDGSPMIAKLEAEDRSERMPPPASGLSTTAAERALLRRWIEDGAAVAPHWGFVPPRPAPLPAAAADHPVDRFVQRALAERGLSQSPPADPQTLLRRASLDLTGLPPTPDEIDAFVADTAGDAWERALDRLLASPRFGERMALVWLDAARYADTNGFHHDNVRTSWPYRDWVIRAFNDNMPFDRFVTEQLAGDLLEAPTEQQSIASAFCRMHNINDEGGALDAEYRVEAVCDRIETIATTFLGLTFTCARCHDHKYDPITQDDYYSLFAFFNSVEERGVYRNDSEQARAYPARLLYRPGELAAQTAAAEAEVAAAQQAIDGLEPQLARERGEHERAWRSARGVHWADATLVEAKAESGATLRILADGSARAERAADRDRHELVLRTDAGDLRLLRFEALADPDLPQGSVGLAPNGNAVVTSIAARAVSLRDPRRQEDVEWAWAWADHEQPNGDWSAHNLLAAGDGSGWALDGHNRKETRTALLLARRPFGFAGGTEVRVTIAYRSRHANHIIGRPRVTLAHAAADLLPDFPLRAGDWWLAGPFAASSFEAAFATAFGPERGPFDPGQRFGNVRWQHRPDLRDGETHALQGERAAFYLARTLHTPVPRTLQLALGSDDAIRVFLDGRELLAHATRRGVAADQERVAVTVPAGSSTLVVKVVNDGGPAGFYHRAEPHPDDPFALEPTALLPPALRDRGLAARYAADWSRARSTVAAAAAVRLANAQAALTDLEAKAIPVLVMRELDEPTPTNVLIRGRYDQPDASRPVERRPPQVLGGELPAGAPRNRLGFARWLVRGDHPLTARVHVNRLWQMLFGTGIVASTENFGQQADWPSHPDLLDWLAVRFVESGWDQKALLRLLMTSATYRQSARVDERARDVDPDNRLLAWFPRRRLPGELVRDQALFVSGLLVEQLGGPSVKPYQPPGLWEEVSIGPSSNTQVFRRDDGEALYRRSLYTFWKRTAPSPQMAMFDAPTREFCVVRRSTTNTPLQALVLWNDVQFVEAARVFAQRALDEASDTDARLVAMFRRCTARAPRAAELDVLRRTLRGFRERYAAAPADAASLLARGEAPRPEHHDAAELAAWTMIANTLLSLDETIVRG
jgi:hypothetical protein